MVIDGWVAKKKTVKRYSVTSAGLRESFELQLEDGEYGGVTCHTNLNNPQYIWAFFGINDSVEADTYLKDCCKRSGLKFRYPTREELLLCNDNKFFRYVTAYEVFEDGTPDQICASTWHTDNGTLHEPKTHGITMYVYEGTV